MKSVILGSILYVFCSLANASFVATDGDIDFTLLSPIPEDSFFAFVTEGGVVDGELTGGAVAIPMTLDPQSGQFDSGIFPVQFASSVGPVFEIALAVGTVWEIVNSYTLLGGDTYQMEWSTPATLLVSDVSPAVVPLPASALLFGAGLMGLLGIGRATR